MTKDFSCRTCKNLRTKENAFFIYYECAPTIIMRMTGESIEGIFGIQIEDPDEFFCADHTDRETVKKIREGV